MYSIMATFPAELVEPVRARDRASGRAELNLVAADIADRELVFDVAVVRYHRDPAVMSALQRCYGRLCTQRCNHEGVNAARNIGVHKGDLLVQRVMTVAGEEFDAVFFSGILHAEFNQPEKLVLLKKNGCNLFLAGFLRVRSAAPAREDRNPSHNRSAYCALPDDPVAFH